MHVTKVHTSVFVKRHGYINSNERTRLHQHVWAIVWASLPECACGTNVALECFFVSLNLRMYSITCKLLATPTARQLAGANDCALNTCKNCYTSLRTSCIWGFCYVYAEFRWTIGGLTQTHRHRCYTWNGTNGDFLASNVQRLSTNEVRMDSFGPTDMWRIVALMSKAWNLAHS